MRLGLRHSQASGRDFRLNLVDRLYLAVRPVLGSLMQYLPYLS